jgi:uncharacterized membrane protein YphA (DoxX/SURF4 family)
MRSLLSWVGLSVRLVAAAVWLVAGFAKLASLEEFQAQVSAYELLPHALEAPFAYALPLLEIGLGLYLATGLLVRGVAAVSCVLMLVFVVAMAQAWARGLSLDCGCFGTLARRPIGLGTIARDAAVGLPALVMLIRPARLLSLDSRLLRRRDAWRRTNGEAQPPVLAEPNAATSRI